MTEQTRKELQENQARSNAEFRRRYHRGDGECLDEQDYIMSHDVVADMARTARRGDILHNSFFESGSQLDRSAAYG